MLPRYLDGAIAAYSAGQAGRDIHLGYWDDTPPDGELPPTAFTDAQRTLTRRMLSLAALEPDLRVLDVACGLGGTLAQLPRPLYTVGLNLDIRQLRLCQDLTAGLVAADACALPFPPGVFDRLLCVEAMFHFRSRTTFFAEAARVLRPGGILAVCDILLQRPASDGAWGLPALERTLRGDFGPWPEPWITRPAWLGTATDAGLRLITWEDWTIATLPSHRFTARGETSATNPSSSAALRWLHEEGWLTYAAAAFRRA